jgi:hypothetical protein
VYLVRIEHTVLNFVYRGIIKADLLSMGAQRSFDITKEIFFYARLTRLQHEFIISIYTPARLIKLY